jgi:hypothetical protein
VLYGLGTAEKKGAIVQASRQALDQAKDPAGLHALMREQGFGYIYTGARGGAISPGALSKSDLFETVYHVDGVWIFRLR